MRFLPTRVGFTTTLAFRLEGPTSQMVVLEAPLVYISGKDEYVVPRGFTSNLASVPRVFRSVATPWQQSARAGVLHDAFYRGLFKLSRREADALYYEALRSEGVNRVRAYLQWVGLRIGGWRAWNRWRAHTDSPRSLPRP